MSEYCGTHLEIADAGATVHPTTCPYGLTRAHTHVAADTACHPSCPGDGTEHIHRLPGHDITSDDIREAIEAEILAGRLSIRGCVRKLRDLGVTRLQVRGVLWDVRPDYMRNREARHGDHRVTNDSDPHRMADAGSA